MLDNIEKNEKAANAESEDLTKSLLPQLDELEKKLSTLNLQLDSSSGVQDSEFRQAVESMPEGIIVVDQSQTVTLANPLAKTLLGLDADCKLSDVKTALENFGLRRLFVFNRQSEQRGENDFIGKSKNQKILRIKWNAVKDGKGQVKANAAVVRDVSEQIETDKAQTEFIAAISHELRTPLTTIQNSVSNMLAGVTGKITPKAHQYLLTMQADCQRLARLINDLLDMAKLESGRMPINRAVTNLVETAQKAASDFSDLAAQKGLTVSVKPAENISRVYVDPQRIYQVLSNLISNAIKYTDKGGSILISLIEGDDDVTAVVSDTGIGIAAEHQGRIFNKFYQISRQAGAGYNGSGLGLALSKEIVAAHGGKMRLESELGKGSSFYFSLPKTEPKIILHKHIDSLIERAKKKGERFAVITVSLQAEPNYAAANKNAIEAAARQIAAETEKMLTACGDLAVCPKENEAAIVLTQTGKRYLVHIRRKLRKVAANSLDAAGCGGRSTAVMVGAALYPSDGATAEEIVNKSQCQLNRL